MWAAWYYSSERLPFHLGRTKTPASHLQNEFNEVCDEASSMQDGVLRTMESGLNNAAL
jgi:hypothetical protein